MTGLQFADFKFGQRVLGNQIQNVAMPDGWQSNQTAEPTWKMGGSEERTDWALVVMEPDTSLNLKPSTSSTHTYIQMFKKTEELVETLRTHSAESLQELMGLSAKTAKGHAERFQSFHKLPPKQAALIFGGDALKAADFSDSEQKYSESHLRFVSGLYGVLRPYDDVKPVRDVPPGAKLATKKGKSLLDFWGDAITKQLIKDATATSGRKPLLILLLSEDYLSCIQLETLPSDIKAVRVSFEGGSESDVRKARMLLGRWCIQKRTCKVDELQEWEHEDWRLDKFKSTSSRLVFQWLGDAPSDGKKEKKGKKDAAERQGKSGKGDAKDKGKAEDSSASRSRSRSRGASAKQRKGRRRSTSEPSRSRGRTDRGRKRSVSSDGARRDRRNAGGRRKAARSSSS